MGLDIPGPLQRYVAPKNRPFHEWVAGGLLYSLFEEDLQENELNLLEQTQVLMANGHQQYSEILQMPTEERLLFVRSFKGKPADPFT